MLEYCPTAQSPKGGDHALFQYVTVRDGYQEPGPSLVGRKVVMIIGAHGWGGGAQWSQTTGLGQPKKTLRTVDGPLLSVVTKAYNLQVFLSPCQFKHSKEFKAFKHKTLKSWTEYSHVVLGSHTESRVSRTATPNRALLCLLLHLNEQIQIAV